MLLSFVEVVEVNGKDQGANPTPFPQPTKKQYATMSESFVRVMTCLITSVACRRF